MRQVEVNDWYLEWGIHQNTLRLAGDISSILGMLTIHIQTINGIGPKTRAIMSQTDDEKIQSLKRVIDVIDNIKITTLRKSTTRVDIT